MTNTTSSLNRLLPCPFCGGRPEWSEYENCGIVKCSNHACGAEINIEGWNKRVSSEITVVDQHIDGKWNPPTLDTLQRWRQHEVITYRDWIGVLDMVESYLKRESSEPEAFTKARTEMLDGWNQNDIEGQ